MKAILEFILGSTVAKAGRLLLDLVKVELTTGLVHAVDKARRIVTIGILCIFGTMVMVTGFLLMHVALFFLLPWDAWGNSLFLLILGLVYFGSSVGFILWLHSRRKWLQMTGVEEFIGRL
ncbi:MAG: hypothetical protein V4534_09200 [Myxococcota bacterium]